MDKADSLTKYLEGSINQVKNEIAELKSQAEKQINNLSSTLDKIDTNVNRNMEVTLEVTKKLENRINMLEEKENENTRKIAKMEEELNQVRLFLGEQVTEINIIKNENRKITLNDATKKAVIYGIPEEEEKENTKAKLSDHLKLNKTDLTACEVYRMGKKNGGSRPRPIVVNCQNISAKEKTKKRIIEQIVKLNKKETQIGAYVPPNMQMIAKNLKEKGISLKEKKEIQAFNLKVTPNNIILTVKKEQKWLNFIQEEPEDEEEKEEHGKRSRTSSSSSENEVRKKLNQEFGPEEMEHNQIPKDQRRMSTRNKLN